MPENTEFRSEPEKQSQKKIENAGILKEKEKKDLESRIVDTLKSLNWKLTKKEIMELFHRIEVWHGLDWLKKELEKEKKLWWKEISEEILKSIMDLIKEANEIAHKWIEELKIELWKVNESKEYEIKKMAYLSEKFPWIKKFEDSELWKNVIIDVIWVAIWLADSAEAIFKLLLEMVQDLFNPKKNKGN